MLYPVSFLLIVTVVELVFILRLNSGHFVFTLDDPYIHLALAKNILKGHYGINLSDFSAPSSSILWPFILAPFSAITHAEYVPFAINVAAAVGTLVVFGRILGASIYIDTVNKSNGILAGLLVLLTLGTNIIGLIFSGMEHSLQVLLSVIILWGLIYELESRSIPYWLAASIVIAPLIRYECLTLSAAAIVFLLCRRYYKVPLIMAALLALCLGGFSLFLIHLGLEPFPTSVLAKSNVVSGGPRAYPLLIHLKDNLFRNLGNPKGIILSFGLVYLLYQALFSKIDGGKRLLAGVIALVVCMHMLAGKFGMFNRYEIYIWTVTALTMIYVGGERLSTYLEGREIKVTMALAGLVILFTCRPYIYGLIILPLASNNIYEQQYQMHRFAVEYYGGPIAANDVGYVSFENKNYVLDLAGLGSREALFCRRHVCDSNWMNALARAHGVGFAMIYSDWFRYIPANWTKVGVLQLGKTRVSAAESDVSFYALDSKALNKAVMAIREFQATLPEDDKFVLNRKLAGLDSDQNNFDQSPDKLNAAK